VLPFIFSRKTGFLLLVVLLCVTGVLLITQLPVQLYPRTQRPRVRVWIEHPGYTAVDFSTEFADSIESQLLAVEGVDILEVQYGGDQSEFSLTFNWQVDSEGAKADVESAMNTIKSVLPADFQDSYRVRFFSGENAGYLMMGVSSPGTSPEDLYRLLITGVQPKLNQVEDAELVEIFNVEDIEAEVTLRQPDMLAYGLTISDVDAALRQGYLPESLGVLAEGDRRYSVRYTRGVSTLYDVGRIQVARRGDTAITLQDVAAIDIHYTLPRQTFLMDGQKGILVTASPVDGGNIRKMSTDVRAVLVEARETGLLPADTQLFAYLDPAEYIDRSIRSVGQAALLGATLAMLVVLGSLGVIRNTLLIGISLPVTLILSFILMYAFNVSLNLISLGGMALAVGMVVDSSVVVMENIHRFRLNAGPGHDNRQLVKLIAEAVGQVRAPVVASILTSILVFLPLAFTAPLTNAILGDQAKVVIFALSFSLLVALTLVPLVAYLVYRVGGASPPAADQARGRGLQRLSVPAMSFFVRSYQRLLRGLISRRWAAVLFMLFAFGLLLASVMTLLPLIPKEIIAPPSSDKIVVFLRSATEIEAQEIVDTVIPELDRRVREAVGGYIEGTYAEVRGRFNRLFVNLKSTRYTDIVMAELQREFVSDSRWYYHVMMWDPAQLPLPRTMDLQLSVKGEDDAEVVALLERVRDIVNDLELYGWAFTDPSTSFSDELLITARREAIDAVPGYSEAGLLTLLRRILNGSSRIEFEQDQLTVEVQAVYPEEMIDGRERLANFLLPYEESTAPLKHFFDFREATGISEISSENGEPIFRLYARMPPGTPAANRDLYEARVREALDEKLQLPAGYSVLFENPQEELDEAIRSLFVALAASVALIYLLLAFQFNSLRIPLVILVTVPLGFIGVVLSLFLFRSSLSLNSLLGAILLSGIVVNNAILMIDFYLKTLPDFENRIDAIVATAGLRYPPIVITMMTTVFGMLPLAVGMGEGSNIVQPLGIAVSGGLLISTLFTLFMVPCILSFLNLRQDTA
jgi:HAE1 family hydrophobic/amphiphilic exporter-1